ncbi:hypothetical protein [Niabella drilacis]|nr:hypothetical protein [Niabella drilacis]
MKECSTVAYTMRPLRSTAEIPAFLLRYDAKNIDLFTFEVRDLKSMFMAQKPLSESTIEELNKQRSTIKGLMIAFGLLWVLLLALNVYLLVSGKTNFGLLAVLSALFPIMIPMLISLNKINEELKLRRVNK